jgi:hypothetical protein
MEPTQSSETLAYKIQTPGKFPEYYILQLQHGESLKTTSKILLGLLIERRCDGWYVRQIQEQDTKFCRSLWREEPA